MKYFPIYLRIATNYVAEDNIQVVTSFLYVKSAEITDIHHHTLCMLTEDCPNALCTQGLHSA